MSYLCQYGIKYCLAKQVSMHIYSASVASTSSLPLGPLDKPCPCVYVCVCKNVCVHMCVFICGVRACVRASYITW